MAAGADLSRLLLLLYEGVSTPERMPDFLRAVMESVDAKGAVLREHSYRVDGEVHVESANLSQMVGYSEEAKRVYRDHFSKSDVYLQRVLENFAAAECGASQALITRDELRRFETYDYQTRFDIGPMMWTKLAGGDGFHSSISIVRRMSAPDFNTEELALLTALAPHLRQAFRLNKTLHSLMSSNAMLSHGIEEMEIAICMVRQDGSILRTTAGAYRILAEGDGLRLRDGRLGAAVRSEQDALHAMIAAAARTGADGGMQHARRTQARAAGGMQIATWTAGAGGALLITRKAPLRPLQVVVSPFCPGALLHEAEATALVQLTDPMATPKPRSAALRSLYKLSPTEARLADLLLQGLDVRGAADRLGTTLGTARFHLKQVMAKTGTSRQTELMRLMLSLPGS